MERPYIICHMMTALDGKITGPYLYDSHTEGVINEYDRIHESFHAKAWMCGRKTMEENFTLGEAPRLEPVLEPVPREDYLAEPEAAVYCISVDPRGKLGWPASYIESYNGRSEAHVVEILTERVSDEYLGFLRKQKISYLFAGKERLEPELLVRKVKEVLGAELLLLEGGGSLNGSFMRAGLIDELSLLMAPAADGAVDTPSLFDCPKEAEKEEISVMQFELKQVETVAQNGIWIRYEVKRERRI